MEAILASIVAAAAPLVYVTIGETITEKAGVINLSLEGSLRLAAMASFAVALAAGNPLAGFVGGAVVGALMAAVIAFGSIRLKLNQIAVGFVLAVLGVALALFLGDPFVGERGEQVTAWSIPILSDLPVVGTILFSHNLSVYGSFLLIFGSWYFMYRTRRGLELQGIGERPEGAHARGLSVNRLRYLYTMVGGAFVGVGGAAYSLDVKLGWRENLTLNLGWIALAIVIFSGWHPVRAAIGCYLFGGLQVVALELQSVFPGLSQVLPQVPFPLMILTLVVIYTDTFKRLGERFPKVRSFFSSEPPSALGTIFEPS